MTHARGCCCGDCEIDGRFLARFNRVELQISTQYIRTIETSGTQTETVESESVLKLPRMAVTFDTVGNDPSGLVYVRASCSAADLSSQGSVFAQRPTGLVRLIDKTETSSGFYSETQIERRPIGIDQIWMVLAPGRPPNQPSDRTIHRIVYRIRYAVRSRRLGFSSYDWRDEPDQSHYWDILNESSAPSGQLLNGLTPLQCGGFSIIPRSSRTAQTINTFSGTLDLVGVATAERLLLDLYEGTTAAVFKSFDYRTPSAWTPSPISFQDAGSGVGTVQSSSSISGTITGTLDEWDGSNPRCKTIRNAKAGPDGATKTGTRGSQPGRPTTSGAIQGRGTDRPTYPIPDDFDPESEQRRQLSGGCCGQPSSR